MYGTSLLVDMLIHQERSNMWLTMYRTVNVVADFHAITRCDYSGQQTKLARIDLHTTLMACMNMPVKISRFQGQQLTTRKRIRTSLSCHLTRAQVVLGPKLHRSYCCYMLCCSFGVAVEDVSRQLSIMPAFTTLNDGGHGH